MRRQSLPYTWTIGIPISILGLLQGILLILSVKLPAYPSNPRSRAMILLSWLIITMIEINLAAIFTVVIFAVLILLGKCRVSKYIELFWEGSKANKFKPRIDNYDAISRLCTSRHPCPYPKFWNDCVHLLHLACGSIILQGIKI